MWLLPHAKALLNARKIPFEEINLTKDPDGRTKLAELTGMMTFPQIVIDEQNIGGFQELVRAIARAAPGCLRDLVEPAAA